MNTLQNAAQSIDTYLQFKIPTKIHPNETRVTFEKELSLDDTIYRVIVMASRLHDPEDNRCVTRVYIESIDNSIEYKSKNLGYLSFDEYAIQTIAQYVSEKLQKPIHDIFPNI